MNIEIFYMHEFCTSLNFTCDIALMFFSFSDKFSLLMRNLLSFLFIFAILTFFVRLQSLGFIRDLAGDICTFLLHNGQGFIVAFCFLQLILICRTIACTSSSFSRTIDLRLNIRFFSSLLSLCFPEIGNFLC